MSTFSKRSAEMTIALTEYFLSAYSIDPERVYLHSMSGGGETGSLVLGKRPELYTDYLGTSSQWDGDLNVLATARTLVYLAIGAQDSYYGADSFRTAYVQLKVMYEAQGLTQDEIDRILEPDIREQDFFTQQGYRDQHGGGQAFAHNPSAVGWLFGEHTPM